MNGIILVLKSYLAIKLIKEGKDIFGANIDFVFAYKAAPDFDMYAGFAEPVSDEEYKGAFYDLENFIIPSFKFEAVS